MAAPVSRRRFILAGVALAAQAGNARAIASRAYERFGVGEAKRWVSALLLQPPANASGGPLEAAMSEVLVAGALALLAMPAEPQQYDDFLARRAELMPGHRDLQRRAALLLDRTCNDKFGCGFLAADATARLQVAKSVLIVEPVQGKLAMAWQAVFARERFLIDRHVGRPVLNLYEHTDRYTALGYPSWPGLPTGYDAYLSFLQRHVGT